MIEKDEAPRFAVGTVYHEIRHSRPKRPMEIIEHKIVDILTTRNEAGAVMLRNYVTEHRFCGHVVTDCTVTETRIAKAIFEYERYQEWRRDREKIHATATHKIIDSTT